MASTLYDRIKMLCAESNITISKLESELGFGNSSIKKWERVCSPSIDKIAKVANYFNVSTDYLLGRTDLRESAADIIGDEDIISLQRARQKMSQKDKDKMMKMLRIGFDYAFSDTEKDTIWKK